MLRVGIPVALASALILSYGRIDQILVLQQGRIIERGSHYQLLEAKGEYARMWALQQQQAQAEAVLEQSAAV